MRVRVACHVHSDWSYDGKWSLSEIASAFSKRGYQAVMITEHDRGFDESRRMDHREACRRASTEKILLIPGIEYSDKSNILHFLVWGNVPFIGSGLASDEILITAQNSGGIVVFAHPSRREAWKLFNPDWANKLAGIELWNRKTDGWASSADARPLLNASGALPFVSLDFHEKRQFFPLAMNLEISPPITEANVLELIRAKHCSFEAFKFPVRFFSYGITAKGFGTAESLRRRAASIYRKFRAI